MGMFGAIGSAAATLPYEELLRRQQLGQQAGSVSVPSHPDATNMAPPRSTPGIGDGLPANLPVAAPAQPPRGMFANGGQQPGADYGSHHALHGRGPDGSAGKEGGKFDLKAAALAFFNPEAGAMYVNQRNKKAAAAASYAEHAALVQNLMRRGISADDAELYAMNPEKLSEEMSSRFRTREASEGETIRTPGMGTQVGSMWTAPKTFNNGPDVVRYDPQSGIAAPIYQGKTDALRALEEAGIQPNTPEAFRFMQDLHLDGQGPTAMGMQRERLGQSDLNNRRSTGVSRENSMRSTGVSERNSIRSNETSRYSVDNRPVPRGRAAPAAAGGTRIRNPKTGETMVLRNGQWVKE